MLFETATYLRLIHESLLIDCSEKTQLERVTNRDGASPKLTKLIIKSQADRNLRIKKADKIILNEGSLEDLSNNIQLFHKDIITKIDNLL
ncbi:MAG: dephospho-CoA kinase [Methylophilaceae bacterium]